MQNARICSQKCHGVLRKKIVKSLSNDCKSTSLKPWTREMSIVPPSAEEIPHTEADGAVPEFMHLTFEFVQQATCPHHAHQAGPLYFRIPRRIQIFGIAYEAGLEQLNYLVDKH